MSQYRLVLGTKPDLSAERRKGVLEKVEDLIEDVGGKVQKVESKGLVRLAYPIAKYTDAAFSTVFFDVPSEKLGPLHKEFLKTAGVLRAMVIREGVKPKAANG